MGYFNKQFIFYQPMPSSRVSSLETVTDDLCEENKDLQECLEGEAKKRAISVRRTFLKFAFFSRSSPLGCATGAFQRPGDSQTSICYEV
jgi:hypothetical protein